MLYITRAAPYRLGISVVSYFSMYMHNYCSIHIQPSLPSSNHGTPETAPRLCPNRGPGFRHVISRAPFLTVTLVCSAQVSLELLRSVLSKESALSDLDCVDRLLGMIAPILKDPPNGERGDGDAAMQVVYPLFVVDVIIVV